ncbi:MAG: hypothetical protein QHJ81_01600 [Anaerolineae bacterium]|nr:hypothetical protein [Anaerolineae bacterium]
MKRFISPMACRFFGVALLLAMAFPPAAPIAGATASPQDGIYFDDSHPEFIKLGNTLYYEIGFRKSNGSLAYITDKTTGGGSVTLGSRYECLWGAVFNDEGAFVGGCGFDAAAPDSFSYTWSAATQTLTFTYTPEPGGSQRVAAQVTLKPSAGRHLDMQVRLQNGRGYTLDQVLFPCDPVFAEAEIHGALLPFLPGVMLTPQFFAENRSFATRYPGYGGTFADLLWLESVGGRLALYTLQTGGAIPYLDLGFYHDDEYLPDTAVLIHVYHVHVPDGSAYTTPWVRLRVGDTALEAAQAYRADNGIAAYPSLRTKLGARYGQLAAAPLYKADVSQISQPFSAYGTILSRIPAPGILHLMAFQPGGFEANPPDLLPPAPAWGSTAEMAAMVRQAQARGLLVMPYTDPAWWDAQSPTLTTLPPPLTVRDVAVLDRDGNPLAEPRGPRTGYVISPYPTFVRNRLDRLVREMTTDVPADLLYEHGVGSAGWPLDYNPASPSPLAYMDGWLAHTRTYRDRLLMTTAGYDRLAETEVGFHGSVLLNQVLGQTDEWWGAEGWQPYPLATALARDKAFFYQNDLAPETFTTRKGILRWNLAMGYMLSYDVVPSPDYGGGLDGEWLRVVSEFQKWVLATYADQRITGFTWEDPILSRTDFETCRVYADWSSRWGWVIGPHVIPAEGVMVTCDGGNLTAGVFKGYGGTTLTSGDHYLIETRGEWGTIVRQPLGPDTDLTVARLPDWGAAGGPPQAYAISAAGQVIGNTPVTVSTAGLTFRYARTVGTQSADAYWLPNPPLAFLPLVLRQ